MFAITTILRKLDGTPTIHQGSLFTLPPELIDQARINKYSSIKTIGWGVSEFNYSFFARATSAGELLIFPGLVIDGGPRPSRRFPGYSASFKREQIETFAEQISRFEEDTRIRAESDLNMLVHDLRRLSTTIYNAAYEARTMINQNNMSGAIVRIENVIAAQTILTIRTDALDFVGNTGGEVQYTDVDVFRKVDKAVRCMKPQAAIKKLNIRLLGSSFNVSHGPNVFEVVPYVILDNAIKYSPEGRDITVDVSEVLGDIVMRITSIGPKIELNEVDRIYERGFRGRNAISSGESGSGLGLYLANRIVKQHFRGSITSKQRVAAPDDLKSEGLITEFIVRLPSTS